MDQNSSHKFLIDSWLSSADRCIREGRYVAADEFLQKVLEIQSDNPTARVFLERIQFLTNQLSHRTGLQPELQNEIRHYREILLRRKSSEINSYLTEAKRQIESGYFDLAQEQLIHAKAIDPGNLYATELERRLEDLRGTARGGVSKEREFRYRSRVLKYWMNGKPSGDQQTYIAGVRRELGIPDDLAAKLDHDVQCEAYRGALHELWMNGGLIGFTNQMIEGLRKNFGISRLDHAAVERSLLQDVRRNRILGTVLVADHDEAMLNELTYKLRMNAYTTIGAVTTEEALAGFRIARPDIVIAASEFTGGESGFALFEMIRALPNCATLPIFLTGSGIDRTTLLIGKRLGVEEFFEKPLDYELLFATLRGVILRLNSGKNRPAPAPSQDRSPRR
ncbi:MAG TPA: response regulator [Bacteroidota bacterium]|nr:response regulator [Bacteroidota bacterium]